MKGADLTGQAFSSLLVVRFLKVKGANKVWLCQCRCGDTRDATTAQLNAGIVHACRKCSGKKPTSKYRGVSFYDGRYHARISVKGRPVNLGSFDDEVEAAQAFDDAARRYYPELTSMPNFTIH